MVALKMASCDRNGRVTAAWLVQRIHAFFGPAFWQCSASLAVSTPLLDVTFFAGLSSAAGQRNSSRLRDAALVVHVVDQILLQMLAAEQMHRCVEDVRMRIGKSQ